MQVFFQLYLDFKFYISSGQYLKMKWHSKKSKQLFPFKKITDNFLILHNNT